MALIFFLPGQAGAQQVQTRWNLLDPGNRAYREITRPLVLDSANFTEILHDYLREVQRKGYLTAALGELSWQDSLLVVPFYLGPVYRWVGISGGDVPSDLLHQAGFHEDHYEHTPVRMEELQRIFHQILRRSENSGYPFSTVQLDSVQVTDSTVTAGIHYDPGPRITFDSVLFEREIPVKKKWLMAHLHIRQGEPFDQSQVNRIRRRLQDLPFIEEEGQPGLTFQNEEATLELPLSYTPSNRIDGIIGFLPNEENDGGIRITGQLDLSLQNLFNSGKQLDLSWQRVKPLSQTLEVSYRHPDIFYSPLHFEGGFKLLKEDTSFINREFRLQFDYEPSPHRISFFSRFKRTRLISTSGLEDIEELPGLSDLNVNYYGMGYAFTDRRDGWAGNRGLEAGVTLAVGDKEIIRNPGLPESIYTGQDLQTVQWSAEGRVLAGLPIGRRSLLYQRLSGAWMYDDQLFLNDLYRTGGFSTLRGFNENAFYASSYLIYTLEYQIYYEENSYLFVFADQGFLQRRLQGALDTDNPTGIGTGLALTTGAGILKLAFALGRTKDQPFNFSLSKFHFGYIAKF